MRSKTICINITAKLSDPLYLPNRNLSVIIFSSHFNNQSCYSKCVKNCNFLFYGNSHSAGLFFHTLPKYHHVIIYIYSNCIKISVYCLLLFPVLFTVYYCLLLWPLVHRAIFSTFFRQQNVILHLFFLLLAPNKY